MPRNVEIKAHIDDVETLAATAAALADQGPFEIAQDDTFFPCDSGRLKLRVIANGGLRRSRPRPKTSYPVPGRKNARPYRQRRAVGHFLELEVVLDDAEPSNAGIGEARELMAKLDVGPDQSIEEAYVDLLAR